MSQKPLLAALVTAVITLCSHTAQSNEVFQLKAFVGVEPEKVGLTVPEIAVKSQQIKLELLEKGSWRYTLDGDSPVIGSMLFKLETTPQEYSYIPVEVRAFYAEDAPKTVYLYAVQVDEGRNSASDLFAFNVKQAASLGELFRFYQRAAILSKGRMQAIEEGRALYVFDVQVFFKFLEIARELGLKANLAPRDDVRRVRTFLQTRLGISRDARVVARAIPSGISDVELLIRQIDFMEIEQLERLWEIIKKEDLPGAGTSVCLRYRELFSVISGMDPVLKERLDQLRKRVIDAQTRCITRTAEAAILRGDGITDDIKDVLNGLATPINLPEDGALGQRVAKALEGQAETLQRYGVDRLSF